MAERRASAGLPRLAAIDLIGVCFDGMRPRQGYQRMVVDPDDPDDEEAQYVGLQTTATPGSAALPG